MYASLAQNAALLVGLGSLYGLTTRLRRDEGRWVRAAAGLLFGFAAVVGMNLPLHYAPGIIYDGRSIILATAGLFTGGTGAAVSVVVAGAYRASLGGAGVWAGLATIGGCALVGLAFRRAWHNRTDNLGIASLYAVGIAAHVVMLASQLLLQPWPEGISAIGRIWLPVMIIFPIATVLVGLLMVTVERNVQMGRDLRASVSLLKESQAIGHVGSWRYDENTDTLTCSEEVHRIFGRDYVEDAMTYRSFLESIHPDDRASADAAFRSPAERGPDTSETTHRIIRADDARVRFVREKFARVDEPGQQPHSIGFLQDITEQQESEDALRESERRSAIRSRIAQIFLTAEGRLDDVVLMRVGDVVLEAMQCRYGLLGYVDEEGTWVCPGAATDSSLEPGSSEGNLVVMGHGRSGVWVRAMAERRTIIESGIVQTPEGSHIRRAMDVPIVSQEQLLGNILVGDPETDYVENDVRFLESVAEYLAPIFQAKMQLAERERESRQLQDQLQQTQKMESVGRLAGGIAHDFNNLLTAIIGYAELGQAQSKGDPASDEAFREIRTSADRAAALTHQLLAFSRRQPLRPRVLDLSAVTESTSGLLRRLIGEDVELALRGGEGLWPVEVDPGQLEQIIVNLALNARDAMPGGGRLTIEAANVELWEEYARAHPDSEPGPHVMLAVSDTGTGIDPKSLPRIFEPFYTTKEIGKGTGLGLATVYGIVKQSGGSIYVYSEPDQGTTFKVYFPRADRPLDWAPEGRPTPAHRAQGGGETILVVEDEPALLTLTLRVLKSAGYIVLAAAAPAEALMLYQEHPSAVDLLLTDVVLPGMSGKLLAETLQVTPGVSPRVLFMSGYTQNVVVHEGRLDPGVDFLAKPFTPATLLRKVREVLDAPHEGQLGLSI